MLKPSPVIDNNAHEFYLMAPPGVELFVTSMGVARMDQGEYDKAIASIRVQSSPDEDSARVPLDSFYQAAGDLFRYAAGADGIWITHASMPSVGVLDRLERDLGVPAVSSAQALMWAGLRGAGIGDPIAGFGRLLTLSG